MDKEEGPKAEAQEKIQKEKKKSWGPVVLERRSQRHADDSGTILEKAQEAKRKWNEEDPKDKTKQQPMHINSVDLVSTSSAIGLTSKDRNPVEDKVIRKIVIEEEQKYEAAIKNCTADSYNPQWILRVWLRVTEGKVLPLILLDVILTLAKYKKIK
jgi:hypothetical protein